jgi:FdhD protein
MIKFAKESPPAIRKTRIIRFRDGNYFYEEDKLAAEEPLSIHIAFGRNEFEPYSILMRTIRDDYYLVIGLLYNEGILSDKKDLIDYSQTGEHEVFVRIIEERKVALKRENIKASSACGSCGKIEIKDLGIHSLPVLNTGISFQNIDFGRFIQPMAREQTLFEQTGGIHSASLFNAKGEIQMQAEDIGRHNAVDKLIGWGLMNDFALGKTILLVSGRCGYEIVHKAAMAGISVILSIGAPSSLAVELADKVNLTLVGFLKEKQHNIYTHPQRIMAPENIKP